jgi:hypothetical protein
MIWYVVTTLVISFILVLAYGFDELVKHIPYMDDCGHILPDDYDWSCKPEKDKKPEVFICEDYRWSAEELEEDAA